MSGLNNMMFLGIDQGLFGLGLAAPQHKNDSGALRIQLLNRRIRKLLPPFAPMRVRTAMANR